MARTTGEDTERILKLEVGEEALVLPHTAEPLDKALIRWRKRLALWRKKGLSFRSRIAGDAIRIQRTVTGRNRQTADLWLMKPGSYLLLKSKPTPADVKKAWDLQDYAFKEVGVVDPAHPFRNNGMWLHFKDQFGRLMLVCVDDVNGNPADERNHYIVPPDAAISLPWGGEWP